jgi:hypothetical protein
LPCEETDTEAGDPELVHNRVAVSPYATGLGLAVKVTIERLLAELPPPEVLEVP